MRLIFGITCLLLGIGILSCQVEGPLSQAQPAEGPARAMANSAGADGWVRTIDGWERTDSWYLVEVVPPRLHPLVVAAGQGLLSMLGLMACQRERRVASGCRCGF